MATTIDLEVLGAFEMRCDGRTVGPWPSRRAAELVQLLAIAPGHTVVRDVAIDALWPHLTADAGAANLRKAAHHARQAIGHGSAIVLRHQQVHLFPDADIDSDLDRFLEAARAAIADGDAEAADRAAALYGGDLLPSARYEEWSEQPRRQTAELHLELLRRAGRWERVVEHDPTDESAVIAAMRAAHDHGHRHRAISIFEVHRTAMRDELGLAPGPEVIDLYESARADLVVDDEPIIGRRDELAAVDDVFTDDAPSHLVVVRGGPGMGKTVLAHALGRRAAAHGWTVVTATADGSSDAYVVLRALITRLIDGRGPVLDGLDDRTRSVLAMIVPLPGEAAPLDLPLTRHQVVGAVQRLLEAIGQDDDGGRGTAIVVDDVDRADEPTREVLAVLGDRPLGRLLVVVTHRYPFPGEPVERMLARAARIRRPAVVTLEPLDATTATELARSRGPGLTPEQIVDVVARAEGVPLFVVELAETDDPTTDRASDVVADALAARFADLEEHEIGWLRRLAISGGHLDLPAVLALTGCHDDDLDHLLDQALATGVLVVDDTGYRFRHELVRDALAHQLPPHQRAAVHRDAARRLADLNATPARVAEHWAAGQRAQEAADCFVLAADDALRLGGYRAALDHADRALDLVPHHARALRRRAESLDALGDLRALAAYDAAIAAADSDDEHELRPLQALAQIKMGDPEGALVTINGAEPRSLPSQLAQALTMSGAALLGATGPEVGTELSAAGRRAALQSGDPAAVVVASWAQAAVAHARGELRASLWDDLAETSALPRLAVTVFDGQLCITQRLLYGNRPYDDVIAFTNDFIAEADRLGAARGVAFATTLRGEAELLSGRLDDAECDLRDGARLHRLLAAPTGEAFSLQRLAEVAQARGDLDDARRLIDEALELARSSDVGFHLLDRIYGTRIQLARDPEDALDMVLEAEEAVRGPFETCPGCRITLEVPAAIAAARGRDLERLERYERSCTWLAEVVMRLPAWDAALDELRGHRSLAHDDDATAGDFFRRAADRFAEIGQPIDARRCEHELAAIRRTPS